MGANVSQLESVDLKDLPADVYESIVSETYTVQRNPKNAADLSPGERGAREDEGWTFIREASGGSAWAAAHASFLKCTDDKMAWKFHMTNGRKISDPEFLYGWRRHGSFWPTRLTTWEEREAWFTWILDQVKTLKTPMQKQEEEQAAETEEKKAAKAAQATEAKLAVQDDLEKNT
jgi:hypothetical protein